VKTTDRTGKSVTPVHLKPLCESGGNGAGGALKMAENLGDCSDPASKLECKLDPDGDSLGRLLAGVLNNQF
jgi:hypothetical protein